MNDIPLKQIIESTLAKIGSVADVNTVVGDPITIEGGITIVPFSKVSVAKNANADAHIGCLLFRCGADRLRLGLLTAFIISHCFSFFHLFLR